MGVGPFLLCFYRLRYLKDHLTYSLFSLVSNSLWQKHRTVFAFLLCCRLLVSEGKLDDGGLATLALFVDFYSGVRSGGGEGKPDFYWLTDESWGFFLEYEKTNQDLTGKTFLLIALDLTNQYQPSQSINRSTET